MHQPPLIEVVQNDTPKTFRWPERAGFQCSVVPEKRGNNVYWFMRKTRKGQTVNLYVGKQGQLSEELLDNAVKQVKHRLGVSS